MLLMLNENMWHPLPDRRNEPLVKDLMAQAKLTETEMYEELVNDNDELLDA